MNRFTKNVVLSTLGCVGLFVAARAESDVAGGVFDSYDGNVVRELLDSATVPVFYRGCELKNPYDGKRETLTWIIINTDEMIGFVVLMRDGAIRIAKSFELLKGTTLVDGDNDLGTEDRRLYDPYMEFPTHAQFRVTFPGLQSNEDIFAIAKLDACTKMP